MPELKPCPFCGNKEIKIIIAAFGLKYAHCYGCETSGGEYLTQKEIREAWNTRKEVK